MFSLYANSISLTKLQPAWGFVAIFGLTLAFGTMYIPTKKFDIGNGLMFQWIVCVALSFALFIVHLCIGSPRIWPLTVLSGLFWSTGNITVVPIVRRLGLGVGMLIWSMVNLLMGWASGRFGWFGIKSEVPKNNVLNIIGVTLAAISVLFYVFITPAFAAQENENREPADGGTTRDTECNVDGSTVDSDPLLNSNPTPAFYRLWKSNIAHRVTGILLSIMAGMFYGVVFVPIIYTQENYPDASNRGIDYVASLGLGAFMGSTTYMLLYVLATRWRGVNGGGEGPTPLIQLLLPGMISGVLCAMGQACWLVANEALQVSITFPIAATLPGALATLIGTLFFHEIQGIRNYIKLAAALSFTLAGSLLTGLSK